MRVPLQTSQRLYGDAPPEDLAKIGQIVDHAHANYESGGWDIVAECWERHQLYDYLRAADGDVDEAIKQIGSAVAPLNDYRNDIQAEADY